MCRLFGVLGNPKTPADTWLVATDRSLLAQSNGNSKHVQSDGWGIAWFGERGEPRVEKGVTGAYDDRARFVDVAKQARGPLVVGHLRKASNPMGLAHQRLLGLENSQPFTLGSTVFAHNGSIPRPNETRAVIGPLESRIRGVNDSEVLFYLLAAQLEAGDAPPAAYAHAVDRLIEVWRAAGTANRPAFSGLNVLLAQGPSELYAFCHWRGEHGASFFDPTRPYYQMAYTADARQVVVGSEPFDSSDSWRSLQNGEYLRARAESGLVALETGRIPLSPGS